MATPTFVEVASSVTTTAQIKERLLADLRKLRPFPDGTILRWKMVGSNGVSYTFAAMFAGGSWYTTAQSSNPMVAQKYSHQSFLGLISSNPLNIIGLEIAAEFEAIEL